MRCKCCDSEKSKKILGDFYCEECASVIFEVIQEDKQEKEETFEFPERSE